MELLLKAPEVQVDLGQCSPQVNELFEIEPTYRQQVLNLWGATAGDSSTGTCQ